MLKSLGEKQKIRLSSLPPTSPTSRNNDNSGGYFIKFTSKLCMCVSLAWESVGITCLVSFK